MVDPENKLKRAKTLEIVFGFRKTLRKEKNDKENYFLIFSYLIKKNRLCLVLKKY